MSITEAFRNLNQSIRGIRQDEERAKQNQRQNELDKAKLEYQMNDPEAKYKRQVFGEKIKEVEFDSGINLNPDNVALDQTFAFNQSRDILNSIMPDGMELTKTGAGVYAGTTTKLRMPQWKADELKAQLNIAMAMESGKEAMMDNEISSLTNRLKLNRAVESEHGGLSPKQKMDKGRWGARMDYLTEKRDNPDSYSKLLMDDNKANMSSLNVLYRMPTKNAKLITMLHNKIKLNNGMLGAMSKSGDLKNMVGHTFSKKDPKTGAINKITQYYKKGTIVPNTYPGGYTRGSLGSTPGADSDKITFKDQERILNQYSKDARILEVLKVKANKDIAFNNLIKAGATEAEATMWSAMTETANKQLREVVQKRLNQRKKDYGQYDWAKLVMGDKADPMGLASSLPKKKKSDYDGLKYQKKKETGRGLTR